MSTDQFDFRTLRYFAKTAEHLSFTAGARECGVSQSALSQAIKQLEERLGLALFDRGDRRVSLTAAGHELLGRARRLLTDAAETEAALRAFADGSHGVLRVGVVQTVNALVIPAMIPGLAAKAPGARFDIHELPAAQIEDAVADGELELGISFHPLSRASLEICPLGEEELLYIRACRGIGRRKKQVTPEVVLENPLALLQKGFCTRALIDRAFAVAEMEVEPALEMNSVAGLLHVVANSDFATILPALALRTAPPNSVEGCPISGLELRRRLILLRRQGGFRSPLAEAFAAQAIAWLRHDTTSATRRRSAA